MAQVIVKALSGNATDWYPKFRTTLVFSPAELEIIKARMPFSNMARDGKMLKSGVYKYGSTAMHISDNATPERHYVSECKLLNYLGLTVEGYDGVAATDAEYAASQVARAAKERRPVTSLV